MSPTARGTSTALGYALTLGITTLLVTGLLFAAGGFVEDQRDRAIRTELQVVGQQIAADIGAADRFVAAGRTEFTIERDLPNRISGASYTISVANPGDPYLILSTSRPEVAVELDLTLAPGTSIASSTFSGGQLVITFDTGPDEIVVSDSD